MSGIAQSNMLPGHTSVNRLVHALARNHVTAYSVRAGADVHDVGIVLRYRNIADRRRFKKAVRYNIPGRTEVFGFPDAGSGPTKIKRGRRSNSSCHGGNAPAP